MAALFAGILDMSFTASIIIPVVLAARFFLKPAPKVFSYALWAVVLFRLLCPVSITAPVSVVEAASPTVTVTSTGTSRLSYLSETPLDPAVTNKEHLTANAPVIPQRTPDIRSHLKTWASWLWGAGAALMVLSCLVSYCRLSRRLIGAVPLQGRAYLADHIPTPFVMGILKPRIYIPSGIPRQERSYILAHEEHHIRRLDHILKLTAYGALCLHWFNPLVWLAFFLAGNDMEMSCDEAVIRTLAPEIRAAYAESLLRLGANRSAIAGIPLAFSEGDTKMRIKNIVTWKKPTIWVFFLSVVLCAALLVACAVNPSRTEAPSSLPQDTVPADPESALEKCRTALEALQGQDGYSVEIQTYHYGDNIINDTSSSIYCKSGADWMQLTQIPDEGSHTGFVQFGYLYADGSHYNNLQTGWDENMDVLWGQVDENPDVTPWIADFRWDAQDVDFVSSLPAGSGVCITVQVMGAYDSGSSHTTREPYQVQFLFDRRGALERIENTVFLHQKSLGDYSIRETIQILSESAKLHIQQQYQRCLDMIY